MSESAERILQRELEKLGAAGGALGGALGGGIGGGAAGAIGGGAGGRSGGRAGARLAMRFLSEETHEVSLEIGAPVDEVLRRVVAVLDQLGDIESTDAAAPGARAVIGAGWLDMNPAVVDAVVEPAGAADTRIRVRGVAKEGLIKQRAAREAVQRVVDALQSAQS